MPEREERSFVSFFHHHEPEGGIVVFLIWVRSVKIYAGFDELF